MAFSSTSGSVLTKLTEKLESLYEQKSAELNKKQGTRDLELLGELNIDLDRVQAAITALTPAKRTLDDVTFIIEVSAREFHRLSKKKRAKAAAHRLGNHGINSDCELATDAHEQYLEPDYIWQHDKDSEHEKSVGSALTRA